MLPGSSSTGLPQPAAERETPRASTGYRALWLALSACGSVMLLATTNQLCQDVAVIPLLWIAPLGLYLLSFIICFQHDRWYSRRWCVPLLAASLVQSCVVLYRGVFVDIRLQVASYCLTLFVACMFYHGELARLKPAACELTAYYLMISAGGALGAVMVGIAAPVLFQSYWEYHLILLATGFLMAAVLLRHKTHARAKPPWQWAALASGLLALAIALGLHVRQGLEDSVETTRNFFSVSRVLEENREDPQKHAFTLMHNRITHGYQFADPEKRYWPTSYFGPASGVGLAIRYHPNRRGRNPESTGLRIGVVGLGAGTIATYGEEGDTIRFYEINPEVVRLSEKYFTYRKDTPAKVEVVLGDARVAMENERALGQPQHFDVLAIDAFSGDAIPVHFLTRECFQTYLYHLDPGGVLAIHISSRYFDLTPVVRALAALEAERGMTAVRILNPGSRSQATEASDWALLTRNPEIVRADEVRQSITPWPQDHAPVLWTDDYTNLLHLLR
jgi:hypothetical protein